MDADGRDTAIEPERDVPAKEYVGYEIEALTALAQRFAPLRVCGSLAATSLDLGVRTSGDVLADGVLVELKCVSDLPA